MFRAYSLDMSSCYVSFRRCRETKDIPQPHQVGLPSLGHCTRLHILFIVGVKVVVVVVVGDQRRTKEHVGHQSPGDGREWRQSNGSGGLQVHVLMPLLLLLLLYT
jgi:hypothetical protein